MILKMCGDRFVEVETMFIHHNYITGKNQVIKNSYSKESETYIDYDGIRKSSYDEIIRRLSYLTGKKCVYEIKDDKVFYKL
jgi:hypothetical protein